MATIKVGALEWLSPMQVSMQYILSLLFIQCIDSPQNLKVNICSTECQKGPSPTDHTLVKIQKTFCLGAHAISKYTSFHYLTLLNNTLLHSYYSYRELANGVAEWL